MPLYEYKCTNCNKVSEYILKFGDAPMEGCRFCGEKRLERVLYSKFAIGAEDSGYSCGMGNSCASSPSCEGSCPYGGNDD